MKINIKIGGRTLRATLADNATARDFVSVVPLTLSMKDLFGREKYAALPKALSEKGPRSNRYEGAMWPTGPHRMTSLSITTRMESRYVRPASSQSQRSTAVQNHSTYQDR